MAQSTQRAIPSVTSASRGRPQAQQEDDTVVIEQDTREVRPSLAAVETSLSKEAGNDRAFWRRVFLKKPTTALMSPAEDPRFVS